MPFAGISYRVKPGHDEAVARIFSPENFKRVDSPVMQDETGEEIGCLICTGLFLLEDTVVRVIQHEGGTLADIGRHMSVQEGVHEAERELMPYLAEPRDTETPEGFLAHFRRSTMAVLDQQQRDNRPAAGLLALLYRVVPGSLDEIQRTLEATPQRMRPPGDSPIIATFLLAKDDVVIRVIHHDSRDENDAIHFLAELPFAVATDQWLAPYLTRPACAVDRDGSSDLAAHLAAHRMRCVSHLSAAIVT